MNISEYTVYLFPFAVLVFIGVWFWRCMRARQASGGRFDWVRNGPRTLTGFERRGRMAARDILPVLLITLAAGAAAFINLGEPYAPQSFQMIDADGIVIDVGREMKIDT
ncbi:MAG: hypothetical protein FWH16_02730, partial [Oscillospiraceae bacterium]|nr:hypothetical protein [Oscillospiraceae bacterium]